MACEVCGYSYCNSSHSCPECARRRTPVNPMVKEHVEAGQKFGEGIMGMVAALFLHPIFSFVGFWLICTGLFVWLVNAFGDELLVGQLGLNKNNPPTWLMVSIFAVPVVLTYLVRKRVPTLMKWVFYLLLGGLVLAFVGSVIYAVLER